MIRFFFIAFFSTQFLYAQNRDESSIRELLSDQQDCWNNGDLECFMEGYWQSDQLVFIGSRGVTYGWQQTLENYKNSYPDRATMGKLSFDLIILEPISEDVWSVVGKWALDREADRPEGHFSLIIRRFGDEWLIVSDHSS